MNSFSIHLRKGSATTREKLCKPHYRKGSATGGIWLFAMIMYFVLLIGISSTANLVGEENIDSYKVIDEFEEFYEAGGICADERKYIDYSLPIDERGLISIGDVPAIQMAVLFNYGERSANIHCPSNWGNLGESYCNITEGCSWNSGDSKCEGEINATHYGVETEEPFWIWEKTRIAPHENTGVWAWNQWDTTVSPCNHPLVRSNQTLCTYFTCEWGTVGSESFLDAEEEASEGVSGQYNNLKPLFSFRITEIFDTDSGVLNFMLNIIFILLPLVILIIGLYLTIMPGK